MLHFHAAENWINDPNGFIYYNGLYHLFFQYFPYGKRWGTMHWGHATSPDLIHWTQHPISLFPSVLDDQNGCFSGSAIEKDGRLHLIYTGVRYQTVDPNNIHVSLNEDFVSAQMGISSPDGFFFDNEKGKKTLIPVSENPSVADPVHTRDPKVWKTDDGYSLILGTSLPAGDRKQGALLFYTSPDLENWTLKNTYTQPELGWMWECPDLVHLENDQKILIFSPMGVCDLKGVDPNQALCVPVLFDEKTMDLEMKGGIRAVDDGLELYAPQTNRDENGNTVMMSWLRMPEVDELHWIGMYAWPRLVQLKNNEIRFPVHPNVEKLFSRETKAEDINDSDHIKLPFRVQFRLNAGEEATVGGLKIAYDGKRIQTDRSELIPGRKLTFIANSALVQDAVNLDVYFDEHIFEVYAEDGLRTITQYVDRITPVFNLPGEYKLLTMDDQ